MNRIITYPPVPEAHRHVQEFLIEALKDKYYKPPTLRNIGFALIKFFDRAKRDKENYHVKMCTQGDDGEIEVAYTDKGQDKIVIMIIKQGGEK